MLLLLFNHPVVSNSLLYYGMLPARPPCPSPFPGVCPSSCSLHCWCYPAISSLDALFSFCPQSFPTSGTFPMSHLFVSEYQNPGASASASALPVNIQGWSQLKLTSLISLLSPKDFQESSPAPQFEGINPLAFCLLYGPALTTVCDHWKDHSFDYRDLCWQSNVSQHTRVCHHFPAKKQSFSDFMAAVTVLCDFGVEKRGNLSLFPPFPFLFAMQ